VARSNGRPPTQDYLQSGQQPVPATRVAVRSTEGAAELASIRRFKAEAAEAKKN
jgi:hypothetical protein